MVSVNPTNPQLVTGRVGELADYANKTTFEVIQNIFGYNGPYRKMLHRFGIGSLTNIKNFLVLREGRIYTDLAIETEVLWQPCSYRLRLIDNKVVNEFHFYGIIALLGFLKKAAIDVTHLAFIDHYLKEADKVYKSFSEEVEVVFETKVLMLDKFLTLYESAVFISYLYEMVFNYNNHNGYTDKSAGLKNYVSKYDFMVATEQNYAEFIYRLPQDFVLGIADKHLEKKPLHPQFIPSNIPSYEGEEKKELRAEAKLQCIKNNMRLKTNVLLYFLNQTVTMEA